MKYKATTLCLLIVGLLLQNYQCCHAVNNTFTARYFLQDASGNYNLLTTQVVTSDKSQVDKSIVKDFEGYSLINYETPTINSDGTTVCDVYYRINYYHLTVDLGDHKVYQYLPYNSPVELETPTREGYTFVGWDKMIDKMGASDETITALWSNNASTKIIAYYLENPNDDYYSLVDTKVVDLNTTTYPTINIPYASFLTLDHQEITSTKNTQVVNLYYKRNRYKLTFNLTVDGREGYFYSTNKFKCTLTNGDITINVNNNEYHNRYSVDVKYGQSLVGLWPTRSMFTNNPVGRMLSVGTHYLYKVGECITDPQVLDSTLVYNYHNNDEIVLDCYYTTYDDNAAIKYYLDDGNGYIEHPELEESIYNPLDLKYITPKVLDHYIYVKKDYTLNGHVTSLYYKAQSYTLTLIDDTDIKTYTLAYNTDISNYLYTPTYTNKQFVGWYDASGQLIDTQHHITQDITLHTRSENNHYQVSFYDRSNTLIKTVVIDAGDTLSTNDIPTTKENEYWTVDNQRVDPAYYCFSNDTQVNLCGEAPLFTSFTLYYKDENNADVLESTTGYLKIGNTHTLYAPVLLDATLVCLKPTLTITTTSKVVTHTFIYSKKKVTLTLINHTDDLQDEDQRFVYHLTNDDTDMTFSVAPNTTTLITGIPVGNYMLYDDQANYQYTTHSQTLSLVDNKTMTIEHTYVLNHKWAMDVGDNR